MLFASPSRLPVARPAGYGWCQPHWVQLTELRSHMIPSVGQGWGAGTLSGWGTLQLCTAPPWTVWAYVPTTLSAVWQFGHWMIGISASILGCRLHAAAAFSSSSAGEALHATCRGAARGRCVAPSDSV